MRDQVPSCSQEDGNHLYHCGLALRCPIRIRNNLRPFVLHHCRCKSYDNIGVSVFSGRAKFIHDHALGYVKVG